MKHLLCHGCDTPREAQTGQFASTIRPYAIYPSVYCPSCDDIMPSYEWEGEPVSTVAALASIGPLTKLVHEPGIGHLVCDADDIVGERRAA